MNFQTDRSLQLDAPDPSRLADAAAEMPDLKTLTRSLRASEIKAKLDELVVGQLEAKERLSLLLSMHQAWDATTHPLSPPPNGLIIGPTGSGKTFSVQVASEALAVPFLVVDSTTLVPSGASSGKGIESVQSELELAIDLNNAKLESIGLTAEQIQGRNPKAIVFFDEFDKLISREDDRNKHWKDDVQRVLLKFVETQTSLAGTPATRGVLSLAGGAFVGIESTDIVRRRRPELAAIMRSAPKGTVVADDIVNFGFMPELVARFPAIIQYEPLPEEALLQILHHPRTSPLNVWQNHFSKLGKNIRFTPAFCASAARRAASLQMGARALQQVIFPALARRAYAFEANSDQDIEISEAILDFKENT